MATRESLPSVTWPQHLSQIADAVGSAYAYVVEIKKGKTGVAHAVRHVQSGALYCLKTMRQDIAGEAQLADVIKTLRKEVEILTPLNHRCLPRVYESGFLPPQPFYICTYHPGQTFREFKEDGKKLRIVQADFIVRQLLDALEYLHSAGRTHCDLHINNVLLSEHVYRDGLLIIDFGSGHRESDSSPLTIERGDYRFKTVEQQTHIRDELDRHEAMDSFMASDFRALGHLLATMADAFLDGASPDQNLAYLEFCQALENGRITSWSDARSRYRGVSDPLHVIHATDRLFIHTDGSRGAIALPVTGQVQVGSPVLQVINTKIMQRMRFTKQLSFCEWYFPGGTHSRFEHSLGTLETTRQALTRMESLPAFRELFTDLNLEGCMLAALIHDIGHYPFAHVMEQYVASRFTDTQHANEAKDLVSHSAYTLSLLETDKELRSAIEKGWGSNHANEAAKVLEKKVPILSDLLDGPIDTDKLDYLRRDSHHCGLTYGLGLDLQRIFQSLRPVDLSKKLGVALSGVPAVEGFMIVQEQMLAALYWEEHIRSVIAMFHAFVAPFVRQDIVALRSLVGKLKSCISEQQAINQVIVPMLDSAPDRESVQDGKRMPAKIALEPLVKLHASPSFSDIYLPIARYTRSDEVPKEFTARHNVYWTIVNQTSVHGSLVPIRWNNVGDLRQCFIAAFQEKMGLSAKISPFEVLVDVPWGKAGNRILTVVDERTGQQFPITEVSHLKDSIFNEPAAFLAPIRVYVSPRLYWENIRHLGSICKSADERFYSASVKADPEVNY
ncbi:MAG: HD domain-containing protein [Tepidisphaeraceae bacterium]|jgi:serine/threonine protein kinase